MNKDIKTRNVNTEVTAATPKVLIDFIWRLAEHAQGEEHTFQLVPSQLNGSAVLDIYHKTPAVEESKRHRIFGMAPLKETIQIRNGYDGSEMTLLRD